MILQHAQATQYENEEGRSNWHITSSGKEIFEIDSKFSEKEVMDVIRFGRKFEEIALKLGHEEMNRQKNLEIEHIKRAYETHIEAMRIQIENLNSELLRLMAEEDDDC